MMVSSPNSLEPTHAFDEVMALLWPLDQWLEKAIAAAEGTYGVEMQASAYRGLQINQDEVARLIKRAPGISALGLQTSVLQAFPMQISPEQPRLCWLQQTFHLSQFDLAILAIALAPELDRRYERLYAYLQDDIRAKRPTVDLCLNLLCETALEKLQQRSHFSATAPLIQQGLLHLIPDPNQTHPSLLAHSIKLDSLILRLLLQEPGLDDRLSSCQLISPSQHPAPSVLPTALQDALPALIRADWEADRPLVLYFHGTDQSSQRQAAEVISSTLQTPLLRVDLAHLLAAKTEFAATLQLILREAKFQAPLLCVENFDALQTPEHTSAYQTLLTQLSTYPKVAILMGTQPWVMASTHLQGVLTIAFPMPNFEQRRAYWQTHLAKFNQVLAPADLDALSDRFRLTSDQVAEAVTTAIHQTRWQLANHKPANVPTPLQTEVQLSQLFAAVRSLSGHALASLSQRVEPKAGWDDIVVPPHQHTQLREICDHIKYQHLVWEQWGFDQQQSRGKGLTVLFTGSPGTGKTMATEVIAKELELDLYRIDLSQVVSKYIGETEKNLSRIFNAATNANAILLFDEADALFGKRSDVKDAHDRYANLEISYLLQQMEEYAGLAVLTTNLRNNLDEAFVRRLRFIVEFPLPTEKQRYKIWQKAFPKDAPCAPDLDLNLLARSFDLTGANIRNIALIAAFLAAAENRPITMSHLLQGVRREYQKMGKIFTTHISQAQLT